MVLCPEVTGGSSPGLDPWSSKIRQALRRRLVLSRRDSTIVARHEVPGITRKMAPSPYGTIEPILLTLGLTMTSTVPPGRSRFTSIPRHFVPGYYQPVPPGQKPFSS
jgi:hypothetical protein